MLLSLVPSFNFSLSGVTIDQFTIVEKIRGKNMAFGIFRYVAFHSLGETMFLFKEKGKKQCLGYIPHYF